MLDRVAQLGGVELGVQQHEVEREVELVAVAVEARERFRFEHVRLADEDALGFVALGERPPSPHHVVHLGPARGVHGPEPHHLRVPVIVVRGARVVAQLRVLDDRVRHVDAEARNPAVEPEPQDVVERVDAPLRSTS